MIDYALKTYADFKRTNYGEKNDSRGWIINCHFRQIGTELYSWDEHESSWCTSHR